MHVWCLLDPKQNSSFIWTELISFLGNIREKRTVSGCRCCPAHISLEVILFGSVCPRPAGQSRPTGLHCQGYQTWHLPPLHPDIPPVKIRKRTRHTGHQPSFPSDGTEIKHHLFNASDTAMAVRVDPHLALKDLLVVKAGDLCRSLHCNFRTFSVFWHMSNLDRCRRNVWVDVVQRHPCQSTWRFFSALQHWPTSADRTTSCKQTDKQTQISPHFHQMKIIMQVLYRFARLWNALMWFFCTVLWILMCV